MNQQPLFKPASDWKLPSLAELPSWAEAKRVSIDLETCDPQLTTLGPGVRRDGFICGVAFAIEDGPAAYLPVRHESGENLPVEKVFDYLRDQAAAFRGKGTSIAGANLQYDLDYLIEEQVDFRPEFFRDVQVAEPLLDELQMRYSLDAVAKRRGLPGKDERLLREAADLYGFNPKDELWRLPPEYVGRYAEQDVLLPLKLLRRQEKMIDAQDLWKIYDLESRLLPVLVRMRRRGVRVSFDQLDVVEERALTMEADHLAEVKRLTGVEIAVGDVWKAVVIAPALEALGIKVPTTPKTGAPSIKAELLEAIDNPVGKHLVTARKVNKIRTTFAASIRRHAIGDRIHGSLKQLRGEDGGGRFGRLSSSDPNLQQQPARDPDWGPEWRAVFLPDEGGEWLCADFSQQEPKWLTHYAELAGCRGGEAAADRYREDPSTDNHQMMAEMCRIPRKQAKAIYLGKCYGMGGGKLCTSLGLPTAEKRKSDGSIIIVAGPEGQKIIDQFDEEAPYVRELAKRCEKQAKKKGYIITVLGRRCRFPEGPRGYEWTHKALNRLIQGSSADQIKKAMVDADERHIELQLQVHDELDMTIYIRHEAAELADIMRDSVACRVPHRIDTEIGPDWGHIK